MEVIINVFNFIKSVLDIIYDIFYNIIDFIKTIYDFLLSFFSFFPNDMKAIFIPVLLISISVMIYKFVR